MIDSNVLIDLITEDTTWFERAATALALAAEQARLVINPIVFAEVSVLYTKIEQLDSALSDAMVEREPLPYEAAFLAGKAFVSYRRRGGSKRSPLPDFFIGAHATVAGYQLMTRDLRTYRTYFPKLLLIEP